MANLDKETKAWLRDGMIIVTLAIIVISIVVETKKEMRRRYDNYVDSGMSPSQAISEVVSIKK